MLIQIVWIMFDIRSWIESPNMPLIISGPCSVESEGQLITTARSLSEIPEVKVLRGGIWKPRTLPDSFEGTGETGLAWLKEAKEETGLLVATEVAMPQHVELALKYGVDVLWIGARTVVNPFSVQQLADSLKGCDIPLFVKNPVSPDVRLWFGAIERFRKSGLRYLAAIHRGFQSYDSSPYRNLPMWEIPIELGQMANIPMITDISHICGRRDLLQQTAQKAVDLATDGLMIECHSNPAQALTDSQQQITPAELRHLIDALVIRSKHDDGNTDVLSQFRSQIDDLDNELLRILSRRMDISTQIGDYKKRNNITVVQLDRWKQMLSDHLEQGISLNLDSELVTSVFEAIHKASIQRQSDILDDVTNP